MQEQEKFNSRGYVNRSLLCLECLENMAYNFKDDFKAATDNFGTGLATILGLIEDDLIRGLEDIDGEVEDLLVLKTERKPDLKLVSGAGAG